MRLVAQPKGGFYPTPPRVVEMVASLMQARSTVRGETTLRILGPCCGAGEALAELATRIDRLDGGAVETYGVVEVRAEHVRGGGPPRSRAPHGPLPDGDRQRGVRGCST